MNDNIPSTPNNHQSSRPTAQSLRGVPSAIQQHQQPLPMPATLKTTRSQTDTRKNQQLNQNHSPITPVIHSPIRSEKYFTKISRLNHPTVNSLMHLYGTWIFDCCLLQTKDRYSRSLLNDCK